MPLNSSFGTLSCYFIWSNCPLSAHFPSCWYVELGPRVSSYKALGSPNLVSVCWFSLTGWAGSWGYWLKGPRRPRAGGHGRGLGVSGPSVGMMVCWIGPEKANCRDALVLGRVTACFCVRLGPRDSGTGQPPAYGSWLYHDSTLPTHLIVVSFFTFLVV